MDNTIFASLVWVMAICSGLMAGTYMAFSGFIMRSFARLNTAAAIAAMNTINTVILKSSFMPLFFGSSVIALLLLLVGLWHWGEPGAGLATAAGLTYGIGMFVTTAAGNVPLNNALARVSGDDEEAERTWATYLERWTRWNTVRTVASLVTLVLCLDLQSS